MPPDVTRQQSSLLDEFLRVVLAEIALACVVTREYVCCGLVFGYGYQCWWRALRPRFGRRSDTVPDLTEGGV
jgi:hypothetical protein